jgi:hypothetical protein
MDGSALSDRQINGEFMNNNQLDVLFVVILLSDHFRAYQQPIVRG